MDIRAAQSSDLPRVAELLGQVFAADPVLLEYVGYPTDPERVLTELFALQLDTFYLPTGEVDLAWSGDELLGAALWAAPGTSENITRQLPTLARLLGRHLPRALRLQRSWSEATPRFPHWYLYTLAVSPQARGRGVGTALLDQGIDRADEMPIYLEATSERAAALYTRLGFVRLGTVPAPTSIDEIGMWRPGEAQSLAS